MTDLLQAEDEGENNNNDDNEDKEHVVAVDAPNPPKHLLRRESHIIQ